MPLITQPIPSLLNGVSQQPPLARALDQCEAMENFYPSLAKGLVRRPAMVMNSVIDSGASVAWATAFIHVFDLGASGKWAFVLGAGASVTSANCFLVNMDTFATASVTLADTAYLASTNPRRDIRALTLGTQVLLVNTTKIVARGTWVEAAPAGIATVQTAAELPDALTKYDWQYTISPSITAAGDKYYVRANPRWLERPLYGTTEYENISQSTFPMVLSYVGPNFSLAYAVLQYRKCGSLDVSGQVGFIGSKITAAFIFRNRLGFISANGYLTLSRTADYYNFFPASARASADNDPISLSLNVGFGGTLHAALPFNKDLLLFTEHAQIVITGGDVLAPRNIKADVASKFPSSSAVAPIAHGSSVFFANQRGDKAAIQEMFIEPNSLNLDAADITAHVSSYLPGPATGTPKLVSSVSEDLLLYVDPSASNTLYAYKFYWKDRDTKAQSAWFKLSLPATWSIVDLQFIGSKCFLWSMQPSLSPRLYLTSMDFSLSSLERYYNSVTNATLAEFDTCLDVRESKTGTYDSATNTTHVTLASVTDPSLTYYMLPKLAQQGVTNVCGVPIRATIRSTSSVQIPGNFGGNTFSVGVAYNSSMTFSEQFKRDRDDKPSIDGRLQLRDFLVRYEDSGYLKATVTADQRDPVDTIMGGEWVAWPGHTVGQPSARSGVLKVPVLSASSQVEVSLASNSPLPVTITSVKVTAFHHSHAKGR